MSEVVKKLEKLKSMIRNASFDGWVENSGQNCDGFEEHVQLLRESDALVAIDEVFKADEMKRKEKA